MKNFKITFGNGTVWVNEEVVTVENFENEQTAIDKMIDKLEEEGEEGCFLTWEQISEEGGDYNEDEYIIGGNHGRILYHGGILNIELISENEE
ncbi:MAG TPA: hypothetical protein GX708_02375 [Gallicola sp.]|nr:hypothetical protein [Gallicola sp.]